MADQKEPSAMAEWRVHWPLVLSALAGMSFITIATTSMGLFMEPLSNEFGWSRAQISFGLTIYALIVVPLAPFAGALIDRFGARRMAIPGLILTSCAFASLSLADGSMAQWIGLWLIYSIFALAVKNTVWTAAVSSAFTTGRGLALAVCLSGSAVTHTIAPPLTRWLIDSEGWRSAYFWIGLGWGAVVLTLVLLFFFDARDRHRLQVKTAEAQTPLNLPGLTTQEATRSLALMRIAAATLLCFIVTTALTVHEVPILTERGFSRETAALLAATGGISSIAGKVFTGWMLDRWNSGIVSGVTVSLPAVFAALMLDTTPAFPLVVVAVIFIGYAGGGIIQSTVYLTSRYGGVRNFGKIFGVMSSIIAGAAGIGPLVGGLIYDASGSYSMLLMIAIPTVLLAGLLLSGLGPYPNWAPVRLDEPKPA